MDEIVVAPHNEGMRAERKPWRRPALERLNANDAGTSPVKPVPSLDGHNGEMNAMS